MKRRWQVTLILEVEDDGTDRVPGYAATAYAGATRLLLHRNTPHVHRIELIDGSARVTDNDAARPPV